jgi:NAD(P)-dependent dehydrogenase (short-subunit alcohol dehydrogenase family)
MSTTTSEMRLPGLTGLRVAVTAGAAGIGFAIAQEMAQQGARLAICDVDAQALDTAGQTLKPEVASRTDVADDTQVARFFAQIAERMGGLDALINNAGIAGPTGGVEEINLPDWQRCLDVCLTGQFLCAHHAVPLLKASGGGSIVGMSSAAGRFGYAYRTPYAAAKWGVIGLTQSLAKELGPHNIRVNAVLPGIIAGPRMDAVIAARARQTGVDHETMTADYIDRISMRRMTPAEDVGRMVAFLVSDAGRNLSGQSFPVDGNVESL